MDLEESRDRVDSNWNIWSRVIFYNVFIVLAIYIFVVKGWLNLLDGIHGLGDLAGLLLLLVFIYTSWREAIMLFYDAWAKRERMLGLRRVVRRVVRRMRQQDLRKCLRMIKTLWRR